MKEVVIVEGVRSPVGRRKGQFREMRPDELAAVVIEELVNRVGVDKGMVEDVILGCVSQSGEQGGNIARTAALIAGFPDFVPGVTIDRQCGSSQQAVHFGAQAILSGDMDIVIAGGVESMTRVPMFSNMQGVKPSKKLTDQYEIINQGLSAERIAEKWGFSRQQLDAYAVKSHERAQNAIDAGLYDKEIISVDVADEQGDFQKVTTDEGPRPGTTEDVLAGLKPAFDEQGVITAGNASQMSDGASAVLLMSKEKSAGTWFKTESAYTCPHGCGLGSDFDADGAHRRDEKSTGESRSVNRRYGSL